jgi:predicted nicotinamide N-methyase
VSALPDEEALAALLDTYAPFSPVPLCPEIHAFHARSLVDVWEAAERMAGYTLPAPFWAYPWAAGQALARVILDAPERVRDLRVLDFGAGGGVASLACARAGAAQVIANDVDAWALAVTRIAARRQGLKLQTMFADLTTTPEPCTQFDVVLCCDLNYDRSATPGERAVLESARSAGARILVADAGRTYFDAAGLTLLATFDVPVARDLEGGELREARVYKG